MWWYNASKKTNTDLDIRMNKNYKILFWVGLLLFIVPELLFGVFSTSLYDLLSSEWHYCGFLSEEFVNDNQTLVFLATLIEASGTVLLLLGIHYSNIGGLLKKLLSFGFALLFLYLVFLSYLSFAFNQISFP